MHELGIIVETQFLKTIEQDFLSAGITISEVEIRELFAYQQKICKQLEWIELGSRKLEVILQPFIACPYLPSDDYMNVLKKVIFSYYHLREKLDYHISDEQIYKTLYQEFYEYAGLRINSLYSSTKKILMEEGGKLRHEQFDTLG